MNFITLVKNTKKLHVNEFYYCFCVIRHCCCRKSKYSQTSVRRTRMSRILWMARTDLKGRQFSLYF